MKVINLLFPAGVSYVYNYVEKTKMYRLCESLFLQAMDLVCSKNELTERRNFKFIPKYLLNNLGSKVYYSLCPADEVLQRGICPEYGALIQGVEDIFAKLIIEVKKKYPSAKKTPWEICIKKDISIESFTLSGGKVAITTGALDLFKEETNRKDLIAFLLSHEIAHAIAEYSIEKAQFSFLLKWQ